MQNFRLFANFKNNGFWSQLFQKWLYFSGYACNIRQMSNSIIYDIQLQLLKIENLIKTDFFAIRYTTKFDIAAARYTWLHSGARATPLFQ